MPIKKKEKENLEKYDENNINYFQRLFPKIRNEKPGEEFYALYTISMFLIIVYILVFYTTMVKDRTFSALSVETNQFSGTMVLFLILHVCFLVYDRILFVCQNRNNLKYDYILYDKETRKPISVKEYNAIKSDITMKYPSQQKMFKIPPEYIDQLKVKYNIVSIQIEEFNFPLFQKYMLQIIIVIFAHVFVFFYLPIKGNINISNTFYCLEGEECNDFLNNKIIVIFYILYIFYFFSSGLQIKYGFYDMKRKSLLKSGNSSISSGIYTGFKSIPFLSEIKLAIDWCFTSTCLDFFQWNKFEGFYDTVYTTYCTMTGVNQKLVGQKVGKILKIGMGGTLSFCLIFILIAPLMLFSTLNPTNDYNNLTGATLKLSLEFNYENGAVKDYLIYKNSKPETIDTIGDDWYIYNYSKSIQTKNFNKKQVQTVRFFEASDQNWDLTRPHIDSVTDLIVNRKKYTDIKSIKFVIEYDFDRILPSEAKKITKSYSTSMYKKDNDQKNDSIKLDNLGNALYNCYDINITYDNIMSPPIRLYTTPKPKRIQDSKYFLNLPIQIGFMNCHNESGSGKNYLESYFTFSLIEPQYNKNYNASDNSTNATKLNTTGVVFHVFSDMISSETSGYSVMTFYVSFVLLAGTYIRNFFSGEPEKIILTEMPHPEELLHLCEGIKVSRYSMEFYEEEKLYYLLIELMRSPDYLRYLTSLSTEQFRQRQLLTQESQNSQDNV